MKPDQIKPGMIIRVHDGVITFDPFNSFSYVGDLEEDEILLIIGDAVPSFPNPEYGARCGEFLQGVLDSNVWLLALCSHGLIAICVDQLTIIDVQVLSR